MSEESIGKSERWVIGNLHSLDRMATTVVEVVSIWAADAIVAVLASANMVQTMGFSLALAITTGIALEGVGVVVAKSALRVRRFNQTLQQGDKPALEWLAWAIVGLQFAIGAVLICVNGVWVSAMTFGLITLSLLSGTATLAHMLSQDVQAREALREKSPSAQAVAQPVVAEPQAAVELTVSASDEVQSDEPLPQASNRDRIMWYLKENAHATDAEVARNLGNVSRQTVGNWRAKLQAEGAIDGNGNGRH